MPCADTSGLRSDARLFHRDQRSRSRSLLSFGRRVSRGGSPWPTGRRISGPCEVAVVPCGGPLGLSKGGRLLFIGGFDGFAGGGLPAPGAGVPGVFGLSSGGRLSGG